MYVREKKLATDAYFKDKITSLNTSNGNSRLNCIINLCRTELICTIIVHIMLLHYLSHYPHVLLFLSRCSPNLTPNQLIDMLFVQFMLILRPHRHQTPSMPAWTCYMRAHDLKISLHGA